MAQTVFRIVGADGRVTFSDKPPPAGAAGGTATASTGRSQGGASPTGLPFELQQVASRYPVTLYTSATCAPCASGRAMLNNRGIPFTERTIGTNEDVEALQRVSGESSLPVLTIGPQKLKGFSDVDWGQYLDVAGYPSSSKLPAGYRNPPASPLVAVQRPADNPQQRPVAAAEPSAPPPPPVQAEAANPAGIRF